MLFLLLVTLRAAIKESTAGGKQFRPTMMEESTPTMPFPASTGTPETDEPGSSKQGTSAGTQSADENGITGAPDNDDVFDKMTQPETWSAEELVGYLASLLVVMTFCMREMWSLRFVAIGSNIAFIIYGYIAVLPPVFLLHLILLPINVVRILQLTGPTVANLKRGTQDDNCESTFRFRHYLLRRHYKRGADHGDTEPPGADASQHPGRQSTGASATTPDAGRNECLHSASGDYGRFYPTDGIKLKHQHRRTL